MAIDKITYVNKVDKRGSNLPRKNKVVAADMNEIKDVVNALIDLVGELTAGGVVKFTAVAEARQLEYTFEGLDIEGSMLFVNFGSAIIYADQYEIDANTFTLLMEAGDVIAGQILNFAILKL